MTHKTTPALAAIAGLAMLGMAADAAAAASPVVITASDVTAAAGGTAQVTFNLDFGAGYTFDGFDLYLNFDTSLLQLDLANSSAAYHGTPIDLAATLGAVGQFADNPADANGYSALWYAMDEFFNPLPAVTASGQGSLSYAFKLLPPLAAGQSTLVELVIDAGRAAPSGLVMLSDTFSAHANVTANAVPLPAAWVLALGAGGLVFGNARSRPAGRRALPDA